jgi:peptide/nickel transport system substrate-binding protein
LLGSFLGACGSGNGAGAGIGKGGNTINTGNTGSQAAQVVIAMNTGSEPAAGFDPLVAWGAGEHVHEPLIQSTLVTTDTGLGFANDLATSYSCSEDGMSWTFTIRDDVRFTDGMPLTAHDVAFTLNGIRESEAAQADLSMVAGVLAQDDRTVHITMAKPFNALLYTLAVIGIVPAHAYGKDYGSKPLGSGRYLLEQWDKGQQVILAANPGYYGEKPRMQRVVVVFMEEDAALAAVRSGQVDIAFTSAVFSGQIIAGYDLFSCKTVDCRGISLPVVPPGNSKADGPNSYPAGNEVTCDRAIRQALNYALDRETMIRNVLSGHGTPAYSVADTLPWASPAMKVETDTAYAQSLLERAGWDLGSDGIRSKGGKRAAFSLVYPAGDSVRQALAAEFANQMKGIGIEVTPKGLGWDDIYPREFCDPILWGWGSHSPAELYELIYSSGWGNFACHESAATDRYLDEALAAADIKDSWDLWQKAQWDGEQGIAPQGAASWVWLANIDHLYFKRTALDVADQKPHPHGHGWSLVNNVDRWAWHD